MLKSTAGGGGIGMRLCRDMRRAATARSPRWSACAKSNFSDGGLFLEKFVERARHIEVQIFGDGAGNVIALGERDCSAQRRNQKVIEETPAPGLAAETRAATCSTRPCGWGARWAIDRPARSSSSTTCRPASSISSK